MSVHDQIIWNLHINGIDELLLFLGSNHAEVSGFQRVVASQTTLGADVYVCATTDYL